MEAKQTAACINTLGAFCGRRDVPVLTRDALRRRYGFAQADVMVLFGGSILCGVGVLAEAMAENVARRYVIVGGEGHTTAALREKIHLRFPSVETEGASEAELFQKILGLQYGRKADALETRSTNCGNNITFLLELLAQKRMEARSILLCQDATMQRRMDAGLRKVCPPATVVINYAAYAATVVPGGEGLRFAADIEGMWEMERYLSLLLGEIPRLRDDENGYGPRGKNFIAHVDIPAEAEEAFRALQTEYGGLARQANPLFRTRE